MHLESLLKTYMNRTNTITKNSILAIYVLQCFERIGFYSIKAILPLYLTKHLAFETSDAFEIIGASVSLTFFSTFFGGYLRDHLDATFDLIIAGFLWLLLGLILLQQTDKATLFTGLAFANFGSGLLRPVLPTYLAQGTHIWSREKLYGYLYMSFNVGALLGILCCASLGEIIGWEWSFRIAGLLMVVALISAIIFGRQNNWKPSIITVKVFFISVVSVLILNVAIYHNALLSILLPLAFILALSYMGKAFMKDHPKSLGKKHLTEYVMLSFLYIVFFILYDQQSLSIAIFIDELVNRSVPGVLKTWIARDEIPTIFYLNIDPLANILFGSMIIALLTALSKRHLLSSFRSKFLTGLLITSLNFAFMALICRFFSPVPSWSLIVYLCSMVVCEQFIMPVGLAAAASLSPKEHISLSTSVWMMSVSVSSMLSANLSGWLTADSDLDTKTKLFHYEEKFWLISGFVFLIILPIMIKTLRARNKNSHH